MSHDDFTQLGYRRDGTTLSPWRHEVDFSANRRPALARIEKDLGVVSERCVEGRARSQLRRYDELLAGAGRPNVS